MKFENKGKWIKQISESAQKNEDLSSKIKSLFKDKESEIDSTGKYNGKVKSLDDYSYAVWLRGNDAEYDSPVAKFLRTKGFTVDNKLYFLPFERGAKVYILESAQINESRNWEVLLKVSMPDNMNNKDVEDRIEELVDKHGFTVMDVTATRK